jgi:hypothetical protein
MTEQPTPPWPIVSECFNTASHQDGSTCPQCDGSHDHVWVAWKAAPCPPYFGTPVRCRACGARKCDRTQCTGRRHHVDAHTLFSGAIEPIGGRRPS